MGDLIQSVRILLVEDDQATRNLLENNFTAQGYKVDVATDGRSAMDLVQDVDYNLVVLDVGIPEVDGISVCKQLRAKGYQVPILLLTAHDLTSDRVMGLDAGADDYMVKPFNLLELLARIRALLRRGSTNSNDLITWGELHLDRNLQEIRYGKRLLRLTPKEYGILELLLLSPQRIFSRAAFLDRLWELEEPPTESAISSHIKALRQKLKTAGATQNLIETMYGFGYRLHSLETKPNPAPNQASPQSPDKALSQLPKNQKLIYLKEVNVLKASSLSHVQSLSSLNLEVPLELQQKLPKLPPRPEAEATTAIMQGLWERFKDSFQEQLTFLERVNVVFQAGEMSPELQQEVKQTVHKLVGSLGLFGFPQGSTLARKMEKILGAEAPLQGAAIQEMTALTIALQQELSQEPVFNFSEGQVPYETRDLSPLPLSVIHEHEKGYLSGERQELPLVLVVDDDQFLTESLQTEASSQFFQRETMPTFRVEVASNPRAAQLVIAQNLPDLVLLDLTFPEGNEDGWQWLAKLKQQYPQIPVLVFTGRDSLSDRIMAVRLGVQAFLQKPMSHKEIFQAIQTTLQATLKQTQPLPSPIAGKVMAVDDDPIILHQLSVLLSALGLQVKPLLEPSRFWEVLTETVPDLLILDIEMPGFSGIELCQVVRNDPQWEHLPILFLTAHQEPTIMTQAFASGGDDYLRKPILNSELMARVLHLLAPKHDSSG